MRALPIHVPADRRPGEFELVGDLKCAVIPVNKRDRQYIAHQVQCCRGPGEIRQTVEGYVKRMDHAEIEVLNVAVNDTLVMVERVDRFIYDGKNVSARCMGAFEVVGDKIVAWRDYFDVP